MVEKERACKSCGRLVKGRECVVCKTKNLTHNFKGILIIYDPENSELAELSNKKVPGRYAVRVV